MFHQNTCGPVQQHKSVSIGKGVNSPRLDGKQATYWRRKWRSGDSEKGEENVCGQFQLDVFQASQVQHRAVLHTKGDLGKLIGTSFEYLH